MVFFCSAFAKAQQERPQCYFINAENGLNLRKGPGADYDIIEKLPYGAQVLIRQKEHRDSNEFVLDNGVRLDGNWVQVVPTLYSMEYRTDKMYVFDAYLSKHLSKVPEHSLHNFTELVMVHAHDDIDPVLGVSSRREMYRTGQNCDVRYEYNPAAREALKDIVQFEIIDYNNYQSHIIVGNYAIDTTWQPKKFKLENDYRPVEWEQYYLPLNKGKDSILIKDNIGEWASKTEYYGQINELHSYLISGFAEDAEVVMIDKSSGKGSILSNGLPSISPNGEFLISEYYNVFATTTDFTIREFDEETIPKSYFISFTSWSTVSPFQWISENEFIFSVIPMDAVQDSSLTKPIWLKGTIKF